MRQKLIARVVAALLATVAGAALGDSTVPPTAATSLPTRARDEYAVFRTVLAMRHATTAPRVVIDRLSDGSRVARFSGPGISPATRADLVAVNRTASRIEDHFGLPARIDFVTEAEVKQIFADSDGWRRFYRRYPGAPGIISFSRVGFNEARDEAAVYVGQQSDWLAGVGVVVVLRKVAGAWQVVAERQLWIS